MSDMKPLPWSYSSLETFRTCPRMYYHKYIAKDVEEEPTDAQNYGTYVHTAFEARVADGIPLPDGLRSHEGFLNELARLDNRACELRVGLSAEGSPCGFHDPSVWARGVVDFRSESRTVGDQLRFRLVDYKTGRPHERLGQLQFYALHCFHSGAAVVDCRYYWLRDPAHLTRVVYGRDDFAALWSNFVPVLRRYNEGFVQGDFPPTPNVLCAWCPVTSCEFWRPRRG